MREWGPEQVQDLAALVAAAAPDEDLSADELLAACFERAGVVLAAPGGVGAVAVGVEPGGAEGAVAVVRVLAVHPSARRRGVGSMLLAAAEEWAVAADATRVTLGGVGPFSIWAGPEEGSDVASLAGASGFAIDARERGATVAAAFRSAPPEAVAVRRAVSDQDAAAVVAAVSRIWPGWAGEVDRALEHGTCHVATDAASSEVGEHDVLGLGCHSVARAGWIGPLGVRPDRRRAGIGHALLGQVCRDLMIAEIPAAVVPTVSSPEAHRFLQAAGAEPGPTLERWVKRLGPR